MKKLFASCSAALLLVIVSLAQTPTTPPAPQEPAADDVVRISTALVQTDLVVTDKDGKVIPDLKLDEFKVFENGKRQEIRFMEFVNADSADSAPRLEGNLVVAGKPVDPEISKNLSSKDLRRVFAFVVDDLTVPFEDVISVRQLLTNFVDTRMQPGDLVAIIRVVGGSGLLQQFTSDKAILRKAIAQINPQLSAYSASNNLPSDQQLVAEVHAAVTAAGATNQGDNSTSSSNTNMGTSNEGVNRGFRALLTLQVAGDVITNLKGLPGRKNLILISGGMPFQESAPTEINSTGIGTDDKPIIIMETRNSLGNVSQLLNQLLDKASRSGVVINAMDIRGLKASGGVAKFTDPGNEATSAIALAGNTHFGRTANMAQFDNQSLDTLSSHLGLAELAESTGGISIVNTNDFSAGLDRVLARSSYYLLAYSPTEAFDNKYRKLEIKVTRPGAKVYSREGYVATADSTTGPPTREQAIFRAVMSPLAKREVDLAGRLQYRFVPEGAEIDINLLVNANNISFKQESDGKYRATFDIVGFMANSAGRSAGGFSQTVTTSLTPKDYQRSLTTGLSYTAHAQLPPGSFQLRAVVRDTESGRMGSMSQYVEIADINKKRLTASSIFLYAIDVSQGSNAKPDPLTNLRELPRNHDLRYAMVIYNPKATADKQTQLRSQVIISRAGKVVFQEPESAVGGTLTSGQLVKIGQLGLGKSQAGRYVLTLVVTDPQAKKEERTLLRSVDFYLVD